jgi:uncharacterized RDD family membrane protein YckC
MSTDAAQIDSTVDVVTPENIAFRYQAAGPFRRLPAFAIDFAIRAVIIIMAVIVFAFVAGVLVTMTGIMLYLAAFTLLWFVLSWFYGGIFEAYWNGQTPGKRLMGIRVLRTDGQPINGLQAVMRNVMRFLDMMPVVPIPLPDSMVEQLFGTAQMIDMPFVPIFLLGLITPMLNRRYQRLGDIVCGTMVVVEERSWLFGVAKLDDPRAEQLAAWIPANFQISRSLARALAVYVERRKFFAPPRRREIARHLGEPLLEKLNFPRDTSHDLLLCALYYRAFVADRGDARLDSSIPESSPLAAAESVFQAAPAPLTSSQLVGVNIVSDPVSARLRR